MTTHSLYGPSSMPRRVRCPGSARIERDLPEVPSEAADEGTRLHSLCNAIILGKDAEVSSEDEAIIAQVRLQLAALSPAWDDVVHGRAKPHLVASEQRLDHPTIPGFFGTPDLFAALGPNDHWLVQWKFGWDHDDDDLATQMRSEAALVLANYGGIDVLNLAAICPRTRYNWRGAVLASDIFLLESEVEVAMTDGGRPDAPLVPGPQQCKYCKGASGACPAVRREVSTLAQRAPESILTVPEAARLAAMAPAVERVLEAARARLRAAVQAGDPEATGWRLVDVATRSCQDPHGAYSTCHQWGISSADFAKNLTVKVPAVEKLLAEKIRAATPGMTAREATAEAAKALEPYTTRGGYQRLTRTKGA